MGAGGLTSWPPSQRGLITSAIVYDESIAPIAPPSNGAAWALDYAADDLSLFLARSGWNDGGAMLGFKAGVYGGHGNFDRLKANGPPGGSLDFGHDHADDMTMFFFADGEWLTTSVPAYFIGRANGSPQGNKTRYANSLLVDGNGQLGEGVRSGSIQGSPWFFDRVATMPIKASTAHYAFVLGAGSRLYDAATGLDTFGRAVLFVDRETPVVRDVVRAKSAHRFDVVWHAIDGVTRDGDWLELHAKNDRALGVRVVSPPGFALDTESQTAVHLDKFDPDGAMTAALVHPATATSAVTFLSVLVPARASAWASRTKVDAIDAKTPERGVTIATDAPTAVVMNDDPTESSAAGALSVTGMAGAHKTQAGKTVRALLAAGTKLAIDGRAFIEVGAPATVEIEPTADGVALRATRCRCACTRRARPMSHATARTRRSIGTATT